MPVYILQLIVGIYFTLPLSASVGECVDKSSELKTTARAFSWSPVKIVSPSASHLLQAVWQGDGGDPTYLPLPLFQTPTPQLTLADDLHIFFSPCLGRGFLGWESRCKKTRLQTAAQSSTVVKLTTQQIGSQDTSVEPHRILFYTPSTPPAHHRLISISSHLTQIEGSCHGRSSPCNYSVCQRQWTLLSIIPHGN